MNIVLLERAAYIGLCIYVGGVLLILNRRLARRLRVEMDWADWLGRYGLGITFLLHGVLSLATQLGAPPEWRLPFAGAALTCVAIGISRDLWWPKKPGR